MSEDKDSPLSPELERACKEGDLSTVSQLYVKTIRDDTSKRRDVISAMALIAAKNAQPQLLLFCFERGLSLNPESVNPELIYAALDSATERAKPASDGSDPTIKVFKVLLSKGWDVNQYLEMQGDALTTVCASGTARLVSFLLSHGANPNSGAAYSVWTAPIHAVAGEFRSQEVLEELLGHGLKVKDTGVLIAAAEHGNTKAVERLLKIDDIDLEEVVDYDDGDPRKEEEKGTALYKAAEQGHKDICCMLIAKGASLEFEDGKGRSVREVAKGKGLDLDDMSSRNH